jgi:hypothetical protein
MTVRPLSVSVIDMSGVVGGAVLVGAVVTGGAVLVGPLLLGPACLEAHPKHKLRSMTAAAQARIVTR